MTTHQADHARAAAELCQETAWFLSGVIGQLKSAAQPLTAARAEHLHRELALIFQHIQITLKAAGHPTAGPTADIDPPTRDFDLLNPSQN